MSGGIKGDEDLKHPESICISSVDKFNYTHIRHKYNEALLELSCPL